MSIDIIQTQFDQNSSMNIDPISENLLDWDNNLNKSSNSTEQFQVQWDSMQDQDASDVIDSSLLKTFPDDKDKFVNLEEPLEISNVDNNSNPIDLNSANKENLLEVSISKENESSPIENISNPIENSTSNLVDIDHSDKENSTELNDKGDISNLTDSTSVNPIDLNEIDNIDKENPLELSFNTILNPINNFSNQTNSSNIEIDNSQDKTNSSEIQSNLINKNEESKIEEATNLQPKVNENKILDKKPNLPKTRPPYRAPKTGNSLSKRVAKSSNKDSNQRVQSVNNINNYNNDSNNESEIGNLINRLKDSRNSKKRNSTVNSFKIRPKRKQLPSVDLNAIEEASIKHMKSLITSNHFSEKNNRKLLFNKKKKSIHDITPIIKQPIKLSPMKIPENVNNSYEIPLYTAERLEHKKLFKDPKKLEGKSKLLQNKIENNYLKSNSKDWDYISNQDSLPGDASPDSLPLLRQSTVIQSISSLHHRSSSFKASSSDDEDELEELDSTSIFLHTLNSTDDSRKLVFSNNSHIQSQKREVKKLAPIIHPAPIPHPKTPIVKTNQLLLSKPFSQESIRNNSISKLKPIQLIESFNKSFGLKNESKEIEKIHNSNEEQQKLARVSRNKTNNATNSGIPLNIILHIFSFLPSSLLISKIRHVNSYWKRKVRKSRKMWKSEWLQLVNILSQIYKKDSLVIGNSMDWIGIEQDKSNIASLICKNVINSCEVTPAIRIVMHWIWFLEEVCDKIEKITEKIDREIFIIYLFKKGLDFHSFIKIKIAKELNENEEII